MDREKVIRIIDELIFEAQKEPTWKAENALRCLKKELLKEHDAMLVEHSVFDGVKYGGCPRCNARIDNLVNPKACGYCGQAVKWE